MRLTDYPILLEIRDEYIRLRQAGNSRDSAEKMLRQNYANEITHGKNDDGRLFWIGLADAQYYRKELTTSAAEKALEALTQMESAGWDITSGDISRRRSHYAEAPMPERGVGKPRAKFRCKWRKGDVYAHLLDGSDTERLGISGHYALLRKVDDVEFGDGRLLPVVTVSICEKEKLPSASIDFQGISVLKIGNGRFGTPRNTFEYRAEILVKNERQLNSLGLRYVGCFPDACSPADEVILTHPGNIMMIRPEALNSDLCLFWKMNFYYTFGHMPD